MKQKYEISRDEESGQLVLRELAELDKDILSLLCEERYDFDLISQAMEKGGDDLKRILRTKNMFPPGLYMTKIAEMVSQFIRSEEPETMEIFFQDTEFLTRYKAEEEEVAAAEEEEEEDTEEEKSSGEDEDIDELLEDDIEDVDDLKSSLGISPKKNDDESEE